MLGKKNKQAATGGVSLISKGCQITGDLELQCDLQVDGYIEGTIKTERTIMISPSGRINGNIQASHVIVNGLVEGTCTANNVDILENGKLKGVVYSQALTITKGGMLVGENRENRPEGVTPLPKKPSLEVADTKNTTEKKTATAN
ncbi:hypothetical protein VST7929_03101 [Vibrio stylophorae]|jgi:cytoskeletal protein CcmA (bactofilin family)|uniref:Polymer-forming cytoskeletal protein n=1 Tax=Vibrio stylophorae TaxID=659351 RepID=A0ABM8ZXQ2_9VIBR|nr:polymer-forming cytoskeletal protein [Vibrio stylophorae]CAH0535532.1 hypothetical protein VST7929_03101 [Vibrio stylophorae]